MSWTHLHPLIEEKSTMQGFAGVKIATSMISKAQHNIAVAILRRTRPPVQWTKYHRLQASERFPTHISLDNSIKKFNLEAAAGHCILCSS
jgi:hypothetical protein